MDQMTEEDLAAGLLTVIEHCSSNGDRLHAGVVARSVAKDFIHSLIGRVLEHRQNSIPPVKYRFDKELWPDGAPAPAYQMPGDSAVDLVAAEDCDIAGGRSIVVRTGLHVELPPGFEGQVRPRSGLAAKWQITVTNSPGTIDNQFKGEIKVLLTQHVLGGSYHIRRGDRIAQLVIARVAQAIFVAADELSETRRGEGGFGSTGA